MSDFEARKIIWVVLSKIFREVEQLDFVWIFSPDDMEEVNRMPDGVGYLGCVGVVRDVEP
jgi:hypothetical protein